MILRLRLDCVQVLAHGVVQVVNDRLIVLQPTLVLVELVLDALQFLRERKHRLVPSHAANALSIDWHYIGSKLHATRLVRYANTNRSQGR